MRKSGYRLWALTRGGKPWPKPMPASQTGEKLNSDIDSGHKSTLLVQLGNISQRTGRNLNIDPKTGHILDDKDALRFWQRSYEKGWEMKL